jgi:iron complex outermembrane receptor protein
MPWTLPDQANPSYPNVNTINGDARYSIYNLAFNAGYDWPTVEAYAFGSYGNRVAKSYENYRAPSRVSGKTSTGTTVYPLAQGFQPQGKHPRGRLLADRGHQGQAPSGTMTCRAPMAATRWALHAQFGQPGRLSMLQAQRDRLTGLQRNFYDGQLTNSEWSANLDISAISIWAWPSR